MKIELDDIDNPSLRARERALISSVYYGREAYEITLDPGEEVPGIDKYIRVNNSDKIYLIQDIEDDFMYVLEMPEDQDLQVEDYVFDPFKAELIK